MALKLWIPFVTQDTSTKTDYKNYGYCKDAGADKYYSDVATDTVTGNKVYGPYGNCIKTNTAGNTLLANTGIWITESGNFSFGGWFMFDPDQSATYYGGYETCGILGVWPWNLVGFGLGFTNEGLTNSYRLCAVARNNAARIHNFDMSLLPDKVWHHIFFTVNPHDTGEMKAYINGEYITTVSNITSGNNIMSLISDSGLYMNVSCRWTGNASKVRLPFYVLDIRVYDEELSAGEVKRIAKNQANQYIHYKLDGFKASKGIELDVGGLKNNGTIHGNLLLRNDAPRYSQCSLFSGAQYITVPDVVSENVYNNGFTTSIWFNPTNVTSTQEIVNNSVFRCWVSNVGKLYVSLFGNLVADGTYSISANTWYHICLTNDGQEVSLYINGELNNTVASPHGQKTDTAIHIGKNAAANAYFNGKLSDFRLYASVFDDHDAKKLYEEDAYVSKSQYGSRELIEETGTYKLTKTGTSKITEFNEINDYKTNIYSNKLESPELLEY